MNQKPLDERKLAPGLMEAVFQSERQRELVERLEALRIKMDNKISGLTEGRMVHYVMDDGVHRPAVIVKVHNKSTGTCNLQIFTDGPNDGYSIDSGVIWEALVSYSNTGQTHTWHFIERVD